MQNTCLVEYVAQGSISSSVKAERSCDWDRVTGLILHCDTVHAVGISVPFCGLWLPTTPRCRCCFRVPQWLLPSWGDSEQFGREIHLAEEHTCISVGMRPTAES